MHHGVVHARSVCARTLTVAVDDHACVHQANCVAPLVRITAVAGKKRDCGPGATGSVPLQWFPPHVCHAQECACVHLGQSRCACRGQAPSHAQRFLRGLGHRPWTRQSARRLHTVALDRARGRATAALFDGVRPTLPPGQTTAATRHQRSCRDPPSLLLGDTTAILHLPPPLQNRHGPPRQRPLGQPGDTPGLR